MPLTLDDFLADRHAATYLPALEAHPKATSRLLDLLNNPENEQRLIHAEELERPALAGVVRFIEEEPAIAQLLAMGAAGHRFRQAVGVAVKLKMEALGWTAAGKKGVVPRARHFTKAERYTPDASRPLMRRGQQPEFERQGGSGRSAGKRSSARD